VKLTADFENTAYVLAFDDDMVAAALQERYGVSRPGAGRAFLEKIIQIPLHLPAADPIALRQFCFEGVDQALEESGVELAEQQAQEFARHFVSAFEARLRTPRMAKLYTNILSFSLPILRGEVHPVDLMLIEGMRVFYPKLYALVRENQDVVLGREIDLDRDEERKRERTRQVLRGGLEDLDPDMRETATKLLRTLFPQLNAVYGTYTTYGAEWQDTWAKSQRIASREYFPRYFSYSVTERDIPDQEIRSLFAAAEHQPPEHIIEMLAALVKDNNAEKFVWKMRRHEQTALPCASHTLALALARSGASFPNPEALFRFMTPRSQVAMSIWNLIENLPTVEERVELAEKVLIKADSLSFASECFEWFSELDDERPNPKALLEEQKRHLGMVLARRIASEAEGDRPIFVSHAEEAARLLYIWKNYGEQGQAEEHVRSSLARDPVRALDLMRSVLGTVWGESGAARKGEFKRNQYDALAELVQPAVVEEALQSHFGSEYVIPKEYPHSLDEETPGLRLAMQFAWLHEWVATQEGQQETVASMHGGQEPSASALPTQRDQSSGSSKPDEARSDSS
jgi:hypothetical protein